MEISNEISNIDLSGKIKFFNSKKGFGKITKDIDKTDLFFHFSKLEQDNAIAVLGEVSKLEGESVIFQLGTRNNKGEQVEQATNIRFDHSKRCVGFVTEYDDDKGIGYITEYNSKEMYYFHFRNAKGFSSDKFIRIETGEPVVFTPQKSQKQIQATDFVLIDDRYPLELFAEFKDLDQSLKNLANHLAEKKNEYWDYIKEPSNGVPVLFSYINQIFSRTKLQDKIVIGKKENKKYAYFNTALVTPEQDEIYAYFIENPEFEELDYFGLSVPKWSFLEFNTDQSRYSDYFTKLPKIATFFEETKISQLIFDTSIKVKLKKAHLIDRKYRFPAKIRNLDDDSFLEEIRRAVDLATIRAKRNYKTAIPHFFQNRIQILLPLFITNKFEADVALVVDKVDESYVGHTVLTLDQAFQNARLLAKPDREWLIP